MNIDVNISKYMKNDAGRILAVEYTAALTHADYAGVSSSAGGLVAADLSGDASIEDMKAFVTGLIAGDANLLSVHLSDLNFKFMLANSVQYSTAPEPTVEELREQIPPLSRRQFWLGAHSLGVAKADVMAYAANDPALLIEVEESTEFQRTYGAVTLLSPLLGITNDQLDDVWMWFAAA